MLKRLRNLLILAGLGLALAELLTLGGQLGFLDNMYGDFWRQLAGKRYEPRHTLIVSVDDAALAARPELPLVFWSPVFARCSQVLRAAGAKAVGFDVLFSLSVEDWLKKLELSESSLAKDYDLPFKRELATGEISLGALLVYKNRDKPEISLPVSDFYFALPAPRRARVGLTNFIFDPDEVVRSFYPRLASQAPLTLAVLLAARLAELDPEAKSFSFPGRELPGEVKGFTIDYCGPPGSVPRLSLERLLADNAAEDPLIREAVRGRAVIVAFEQSGSQDLHPTPYSRGLLGLASRLMSGPEVHANIVESLLSGHFSQPAPWALRIGLEGLCLLIGCALFLLIGPWPGAICLAGLGAASAGLSYYYFLHWLKLGVAGPQLGLFFCYFGSLGFRLSREEKLRRKLRGIFGRYVSGAVLEKLLAQKELPNLGGELYEITVLFCDIRDFTSFSEKLKPEEVLEFLNGYFSLICQPIMEQGGAVDKFIGDAVMAIFGAPAKQADHAARAVRCAREIARLARDYEASLAERFPGRDLPGFRVGIGLNSGQAVIGNVGSPERLEYTAIGDSVNTASRIEGLSKTLGWTILASQSTVSAAACPELCGHSLSLRLKGKHEEVTVYEIVESPETKEKP